MSTGADVLPGPAPTRPNGTDRGVTLVTGAAGGIGAAVVAHLAGHGGRVVAVDRDVDGLARLAADVPGVVTRHLDLTATDDVPALVADVEAEVGPIEGLVNAAGILRAGALLDAEVQDVVDTLAVNVVGTFAVSRSVAAAMVTRGRGAIVTVASNAARVPRTGMGAYPASKSAAEMLTRCLGLETAPHGVRCNVVAPGSTDTRMLRGLWTTAAGETASIEGDLTTFRTGIPLGRIAAPEDVARVVAFLLSDDARHITLQSLTVDGGAALGA